MASWKWELRWEMRMAAKRPQEAQESKPEGRRQKAEGGRRKAEG
jgi:hypothetical protein